MDAVVAHSEHGAARLREEVGLDPGRVRVIPHGAFDYLTRLPEEEPLPPELEGAEGPVILFFGLLRPYKGIDTLLEAFRRIEGAELWIVGNPRMDARAAARGSPSRAPGRVRFVTRFVDDAEIPAIFRRADVVVLPYRDAEHSGVLYTGLAFGKPLVLARSAASPSSPPSTAPRASSRPEDPAALAAALAELVGDEARARRARRRRRAAPPRAPTPGTRSPRRPSTSTGSCAAARDDLDRRSQRSSGSRAGLIVYTHAGYPLAAVAARSPAPRPTPPPRAARGRSAAAASR